MDRLTTRGPEGNAYYPKCFEGECFGMESREECEKCQFTFDICERLTAYEELGLLPEQLREIDKLYQEKCEEVERLKAQLPPCKVGDTVWFVNFKKVCNGIVTGFRLGKQYNEEDEDFMDKFKYPSELYISIDTTEFSKMVTRTQFEKSIYFSETEAQEALERMV